MSSTKYGKDFATHHQSVCDLMASFSEVAASGAERQYAWLPTERTAEEIATPSGGNRWVGYPYTKYMCANDNVDGAASWLLCSVRTAKRLGVERSRWVYLLSGAQCHEGSDDKWFVSGREDLTAQPAMRSSITNCLVRRCCPGFSVPASCPILNSWLLAAGRKPPSSSRSTSISSICTRASHAWCRSPPTTSTCRTTTSAG